MKVIFKLRSSAFIDQMLASMQKLHEGYYRKYPTYICGTTILEGQYAGLSTGEGWFAWTTCAGNKITYDLAEKTATFVGTRGAFQQMAGIPAECDCTKWKITDSRMDWLPPWQTLRTATAWLIRQNAVLQPSGRWFYQGMYISLNQ